MYVALLKKNTVQTPISERQYARVWDSGFIRQTQVPGRVSRKAGKEETKSEGTLNISAEHPQVRSGHAELQVRKKNIV